jgi:DNA polymerase III alpha subunit
VFFIENNSLPFDKILSEKVKSYCGDEKEIVNTQSIYYENKKDFKAYLTFRCVNNRTTLNKPNFDHMCSDEFCFEKWKQL